MQVLGVLVDEEELQFSACILTYKFPWKYILIQRLAALKKQVEAAAVLTELPVSLDDARQKLSALLAPIHNEIDSISRLLSDIYIVNDVYLFDFSAVPGSHHKGPRDLFGQVKGAISSIRNTYGFIDHVAIAKTAPGVSHIETSIKHCFTQAEKNIVIFTSCREIEIGEPGYVTLYHQIKTRPPAAISADICDVSRLLADIRDFDRNMVLRAVHIALGWAVANL